MAGEMAISAFDDPRLEWDHGEPSARGGSWKIDEAGELVVAPEPQRDYWSRTFYSPLLVKHDAQTLLATVPADDEATLTTAFTLTPRAQFDQAGIMVLVDEGCWVKAGIEFTDGVPRLSCVVTNDGFSDWSTQAWRPPAPAAAAGATSVRVRVSKLLPGAAQGPCLVMEACPCPGVGDSAASPGDWCQVRIASLRAGGSPWRMGLFAICPVENAGCEARFHHVALGAKCEPVHRADNPLDGQPSGA
ncbi:unnamed protein product [Prorocentrum cordatum]|uniref:DUF1349 domain-containing protein n=1 Tax=Prorocentrum cordatum TaxID=2364126 RepID=A0ABN9TVZ6_9DINO|nr:unnamed protein product [Polarella glacialis]